MSRRAVVWVVVALAVGGALVIGSQGSSGPETSSARADRLARSVRCPTCRGLSAAESDARASVAVRDEITRRVREGQSDAQIRAFLVSRYGEDILLTPPSRGIGAAVWVLPVVVLAVGAAGLLLAFARWRRMLDLHASPEDERLVDEARAR